MDDSDFIEESLKPSRKLKCKSESEIALNPIIESDCLLPDSDKDQCYVCSKDLRHLDELRKSLHINNCLDQQEAKKKYEKKKEIWKNTVDCPICGKPLEPGPFRAAHAKRCGQKHNVNPKSLLLLMDTQTKVTEVKKQNGTTHTKLMEPKLETKKPRGRLNGEPRSLYDEQLKLATALSASMDSSGSELYVETQQPPKVRPPKQRPRSFSFVELEPRACKCAVIERVQENFLNIFKTRKEKQDMRGLLDNNIKESEKIMKDTGMCLRKLNRLEQLVDDLKRYAENVDDVTIYSRENEAIPACQFIIAARAPALLQESNSDGSLPLREYSGAAIRSYISFLTSASVIWTESEREEVHSMARKYGPAGLAALCKSANLEASSVDKTYQKDPEMIVKENFVHLGGKDKELEAGESISREKVDMDDVSKKEKEEKAEDSDDSSIIFVEEKVSQNVENAKSVEHSMCNVVRTKLENVSQEFVSGIMDEGNDEIVSRSRALFCCLSTRSGKTEEIENFQFLDKEVAATATAENVNNSLVIGNDSDKNIPPFSLSPCRSRAPPNPEILEHFDDSIESLLRKLSPVKPLPSYDEKILSPVACSSKQLTTQDLFDDISPEKFISPNSGPRNSHSSRRSLIKTKSSPPYFNSNPEPLSPAISPLSLLDRAAASRKSASPSPVKKKARVKAVIQKTSTPLAPTCRLKQRLEELGSNVKVVKTTDITPMPNYDTMNDKELKEELAKFGIRPMGKKRGTALLKRIYEETHPVLERTPVSRRSKATVSLAKRMEENCDIGLEKDRDCDNADRTLNRSLDEHDILEESYMEEQRSAFLPKDLDGMQTALIHWLRKEENSTLYSHLLGLNVISFEEFADRLSRADSAVSQIPKKALIEILDRLHVTFRMPSDGWERKRRRAKK